MLKTRDNVLRKTCVCVCACARVRERERDREREREKERERGLKEGIETQHVKLHRKP